LLCCARVHPPIYVLHHPQLAWLEIFSTELASPLVPTTITLTDEQDFRKVIKNQIKGAEKAESKDKKFVFQNHYPLIDQRAKKSLLALVELEMSKQIPV